MTGSSVRTCVNTPILDTLRLTFRNYVRRVVTQCQLAARWSNAVNPYTYTKWDAGSAQWKGGAGPDAPGGATA
jgi:hypothetical protein